MRKPNGINIELTPTQFDYLYEVIMFAYEMDVPEQKGWDIQTYDNMVDNVTNGKSTILSNDVRGIQEWHIVTYAVILMKHTECL